jgi:hypothetical protein
MQQDFLEIVETWGERPASASSIVLTNIFGGGAGLTIYEPRGDGSLNDAVILIRDVNDIRKMRDFLSDTIKELEG